MNERRQRWVALGGLLLLVAALVYPVFQNGFVYDDTDMIERGDVIHDPSQVWTVFARNTMYASPLHREAKLEVDTYRPITMLSFFWDSALSGRDPWAYHLTNLLMHLLCTVLLFSFVRELLGEGSWKFALFGTACFALSPHANSAQIWINGRSDLFCTFFGLASVLVWRKALPSTGSRRPLLLLTSSLLFFLGLLSKEVLIATLLPLLLWPDRDRGVSWAQRLTRCSGLAAAAVAYIGLRVAVLGSMRASEGAAHLLRSLSYLAPLELEGLLGALYPRRLYLRFMSEEFGGLSPGALLALLGLFVSIAATLFLLRRTIPLVSWGLLWFASCLAPVALVAGLLWPGFGRYLYLPSAGLAVSLAAGARHFYDRLPRLRRIYLLAAALYFAVLGLSLRHWVQDFRDEESLYSSTITQNPDGAHAYGWLGISRTQRGLFEEAIGPLAVAHERAPDEPRYALSLLESFRMTGHAEAARQVAEQGAALYETEADGFHLFLLDAAQMRDPKEAALQVLTCLRKNPSSDQCGKAFAHLVTEHPLSENHRGAARELLSSRPDLSNVRQQTAPLLESLP
jgi:tetratricopeptide (TPR) repeat protein